MLLRYSRQCLLTNSRQLHKFRSFTINNSNNHINDEYEAYKRREKRKQRIKDAKDIWRDGAKASFVLVVASNMLTGIYFNMTYNNYENGYATDIALNLATGISYYPESFVKGFMAAPLWPIALSMALYDHITDEGTIMKLSQGHGIVYNKSLQWKVIPSNTILYFKAESTYGKKKYEDFVRKFGLWEPYVDTVRKL